MAVDGQGRYGGSSRIDWVQQRTPVERSVEGARLALARPAVGSQDQGAAAGQGRTWCRPLHSVALNWAAVELPQPRSACGGPEEGSQVSPVPSLSAAGSAET